MEQENEEDDDNDNNDNGENDSSSEKMKKKEEKMIMNNNDNDNNNKNNNINNNDDEEKLLSLENDDGNNNNNNKMSSSCGGSDEESESAAVVNAAITSDDDDDDDGSSALLNSGESQQQQQQRHSSPPPPPPPPPPLSSSPVKLRQEEEEEEEEEKENVVNATTTNNGNVNATTTTTPVDIIGNASYEPTILATTNESSNNNISIPSTTSTLNSIVNAERENKKDVHNDEITEEEEKQQVDDANNNKDNNRLDLSTTITTTTSSSSSSSSIRDDNNNNNKLNTNDDNETAMNQSSSASSQSRPGAISVVPGGMTRHIESNITKEKANLNATTTNIIGDSNNNTTATTSGNDTSNTSNNTAITDIPIIYADCYNNNNESNNPSSSAPTTTMVSDDNDKSNGVNHDNSNLKNDDDDDGFATTAAAAAATSNGDDKKDNGNDEDEEGERIQETTIKPLPTVASLEEPTPAATLTTTDVGGDDENNKIPSLPTTTPGGIDIEVVEAETVDEENLQNLQRLMDQLQNAPRAEIVRVEIDASHEFTISPSVSPSRRGGGGVGSSQQQQRQQAQFSQPHQEQQSDRQQRRHNVVNNNNDDTEETASDNNSHGDGAKSSSHPSKQFLLLILLSLVVIIVIVVAVVLVKGNDDDEEQLEQKTTTAAASPTTSPTTIMNNNVLAPTLQNIHNRGYIKCRGVPSEDKQGFGFSYDMCSAFAAAILGDSNKYEMIPMPFVENFSGISNGTIDVSTGMTTPTMQRDIREPTSQDGMAFTTPYFYGGITFYGIPEYVDCANRGDTLLGICRNLVVCAMEGTVQVYHTRRHLGGSVIHTVSIERDLFDRLDDSTCNVATVMPQTVYEHITNLEKEGIDATKYIEDGTYILSSKTLDRDPLAFTTRNDDPEFGDIINWLLRALVVSEVMNITQTTAHLFPTTDLFGDDYRYMFQNAIAAVGNYGELYAKWWEARNPRTTTTSGRGINTPHLYPDDGGLLYPNPLGNIALEGGAAFASSSQQQQQAPPILKEGGTLEIIEERQILYCGIINGRPGLAEWDDLSNSWIGLDVDYCSGLAAALFAGNTASSLFLVPFESLEEGFVSLANEDIDVLAGATYNMENDVKEPTTGLGFAFGDVYYYYDYQIHNVTTDERDVEGGHNVVLALSMATRQEDVQWTDFVRSIIVSTIHAEANGISQATAFEMPLLELLGPTYRQALRDVILHIGNYAELYERNMEHTVPRVNNTRNALNDGTPMFYINWIF